MGIFENAKNNARTRAAELAHDSEYKQSPRSKDKTANTPFGSSGDGVGRTDPPKDEITRYWRLFETVPIVRQPITSFASQVVEPGYYIANEGLDEETLHELENWLETSAIVEGEIGADFQGLLKKAIIQREVKGTGLVEKVHAEEDEEIITGMKLVKVETVEAHTRPGQSILLHPDDSYEDAPTTDGGETAAYVQNITSGSYGGSDDGVAFTVDDIIKLTRDADAGEIFGTSRLEASADRIDGLRQKLEDNDQAIESKAYPLWLFKFGDPEAPWDRDDINKFMKSHEMENFHPGMKQGVRGDVNVDTVSGEVAEIGDYLDFDLNWIITSMPMPKYSLGGFDENVGQVAGAAQQGDVNRQIREIRQEIKTKFTPILREKAQEMGVSEEDAENIDLIIGSPDRPEQEPDNEQVIRYIGAGDNQNGGGDAGDGLPGEGAPGDGTPQPGGSSDPVSPQTDGGSQDVVRASEGRPSKKTVWDVDVIAELSRPSHEQLAESVYQRLKEMRNNSLDRVGQEFEQSPMYVASNFERIANSEMNNIFRNANLGEEINTSVKDAMRGATDSMLWSVQQRNNISFFISNIENSVRDAMDELGRRMRIQIRRAAENTEDFSDARQRIENTYSDAQLRNRANIIAMMELHNIQETTKLQEFEQDPDVIGVRISNEDASSSVCTILDGVEAFFDQGPIVEQFRNRVSEEYLQKEFTPLPQTPPFHFGCKTELEPIYE